MNKTVPVVVLMVLLSPCLFADVPATGPAVSSKPVERDGLQVTVTLAKATYLADEQPRFTVQFKNVSGKHIALADADLFWAWSIRFEDVARKGPWQVRLKSEGMLQLQQHQRAQKADVIPAGQTLEEVVDLGQAGLPFEFVWEGEEDEPIPPVARLSPGQYRLVVDIPLKPGGKAGIVYWARRITTEPVALTITAAAK